MLIPVATNVEKVRRVPYVTFTLVAINVLLCIYTSWMNDPGDARFLKVKRQIIEMSVYYPEARGGQDVQAIITEARKKHPEWYEGTRKLDENSAREVPPMVWQVHQGEVSADDAMTQLGSRLRDAEAQSFSWNYSFHSYRPTPISLISSTFLHGGVLHLLGNMWFLYLAGVILEATWGYPLFSVFYLVGGIAAMTAQSIAEPASFTFVLGASGAIAACMGAFLVRFPNVEVKFLWIFFVWIRGGIYKFSMPALYVLPLWLGLEVVYGLTSQGFVAHWAHVGGFLFGVGAALLIKFTGLEELVNKEDESKTWHPDKPVLDAIELTEGGKHAEAAELLSAYVRRKPDSLDGYETLLRVQNTIGDKAGQRETHDALCRLTMRPGNAEEVWEHYEAWRNLGGGPLPAVRWLELCRYLEREKAYQRAVEECERLAKAHPEQPQAFDAMLMAARVNLDRLDRPAQAEKWFLLARESDVPHLELEGMILDGLKRSALKMKTTSA